MIIGKNYTSYVTTRSTRVLKITAQVFYEMPFCCDSFFLRKANLVCAFLTQLTIAFVKTPAVAAFTANYAATLVSNIVCDFKVIGHGNGAVLNRMKHFLGLFFIPASFAQIFEYFIRNFILYILFT